ncbi:MAG: TetR/AcrR family transcriptional regulator [Solirubrobacterales bacterium]
MPATDSSTPSSTESEHIGRALIDLCPEHGYRDTTLSMLLKKASVDRETFERHFADLEDCFCRTFQELSNQYLLRLGAAYASQEGWANQLRGAGYASLRFLREDLPRARFLFIEVLSAGTRAQLIRDQGMDALSELIDLGRRELEDPTSVTHDTAVSLAGGVYQRTRLAIERDDPQVWARTIPEFMYTLVLPYLGPNAALAELSIPPPDGL